MPSPYPNKNSRRYRDERRAYVADTIRMRMSLETSLEYLQEKGYESSLSTLERDKKYLEENKLVKVSNLMKNGFIPQHVDRILFFEFAERELADCYRQERDPYKRAKIMDMWIAVQPYITSYYEATKDLVENDVTMRDLMDKYLSNISKDLNNAKTQDNILPPIRESQDQEGLDPGEREYRKNKARAVFDY